MPAGMKFATKSFIFAIYFFFMKLTIYRETEYKHTHPTHNTLTSPKRAHTYASPKHIWNLLKAHKALPSANSCFSTECVCVCASKIDGHQRQPKT